MPVMEFAALMKISFVDCLELSILVQREDKPFHLGTKSQVYQEYR